MTTDRGKIMNTDQKIEVLRLAVDLTKAALASNSTEAASVKHTARVQAKKAGDSDLLSELASHYFNHLRRLVDAE